MRKKLAICVALVLLVFLVTVLAVWWIPPAEPPLRAGMMPQEVSDTLEKSGYEQSDMWGAIYEEAEPDWWGNRQIVTVWYEEGTGFNGGTSNPSLVHVRPGWTGR